MIRKPWPIIILSIVFFCAPVANLFYPYYFLRDSTTLANYFDSLIHISSNHIRVFNMIVPPVISAIAILKIKRWSYPTFLICMFWLCIFAYTALPEKVSHFEVFYSFAFPMFINVMVVSYFLIPAVKAAYYDPRLRWWEAKPRYIVDTKINILADGKEVVAKATNISEGGVFMGIDQKLPLDSTVKINFLLCETQFSLDAKIIFNLPNTTSYGVQFQNLDKKDKKSLSLAIQGLRKSGYPETRETPHWLDDFKLWFFKLIKTGDGIVPSVPKK